MHHDLPHFHAMRRDASSGLFIGSVSAIEVYDETWVADGYLGYLLRDEMVIYGRWRVTEEGWGFQPKAPTLVALPTDFEVLDSYWGDRADLVLGTRPADWSPERWDDPADHDHCAICWSTIGISGDRNFFRNAHHDDFCCVRCYNAYVLPRKLDFIEPHGEGRSNTGLDLTR